MHFSTFSRKCQVFKNLSGQKIFSYNIDYMNILKQLICNQCMCTIRLSHCVGCDTSPPLPVDVCDQCYLRNHSRGRTPADGGRLLPLQHHRGSVRRGSIHLLHQHRGWIYSHTENVGHVQTTKYEDPLNSIFDQLNLPCLNRLINRFLLDKWYMYRPYYFMLFEDTCIKS